MDKIYIMKIWIKELDINKVDTLKLKEYLTKTICNDDLYSTEGIYRMNKNKMQPLYFKDDKTSEIKGYLSKYTVLVDNSSVALEKETFQIPYDHIYLQIEELHYSLNKNAAIELIVERNNYKNKDVYFKTREDIDNYHIKEDISTFLSLIT